MGRARGFGLIQLVLALFVVAILGAVLYRYVASTARTTETLREQRPLAGAKLAADHAILSTIRTALDAHRAEQGRWPADKAAVLALLPSPPVFQCPGNDFDYDPADGQLRLRIDDPSRC